MIPSYNTFSFYNHTWVACSSGGNLAMHSRILWSSVYYPDLAIIQYKYPNSVYFDCKTKPCLIVPGRQGKYIFTQKVFIYKVYSMISMNRTHFFLTVNTSTWRKAELNLTNSESWTVCFL